MITDLLGLVNILTHKGELGLHISKDNRDYLACVDAHLDVEMLASVQEYGLSDLNDLQGEVCNPHRVMLVEMDLVDLLVS